MRPTLPQLLGWNTHEISGAGECAEAAARGLLASLDNAVAAADRTEWSGLTERAALRRLAQEHDHANEVANVLQQITDEAKDAGTDLTHAKTAITRAVQSAMSGGFWVSQTGEVTHTEAAKHEAAQAIQATIQRGLDQVDEIDEMYGARLSALCADLASMIAGQPDVTIPGMGTMDADLGVAHLESLPIEQRQRILASMSPADVRRLIQADPLVMGNLDGVPFELRAVANEVNIRNALAAEIRTNGEDSERAGILRSFLGQRNRPTANGGPTGSPSPDAVDDQQTERTFTTFRPDSMHLVEMIGTLRPGTRNAAVYVPGTGTNAAGFGGNNWNTAWNLATKTDGPVFVYLDGDLPQEVIYDGNPSFPLRNTAADPDLALRMAPGLSEFSHALRAELATTSPDATTTYIGHSYGGSVVGTAEQLGLDADNVIYASSAGTGVLDGPWDNANPDVQRFSMTAPGDAIHVVQDLPGNPHGGDPDDADGVTRLDTGRFGDGSLVGGVNGHGHYFDDPDSTAFRNMVEVITDGEPTPYVPRDGQYLVEETIPTVLDHVGVPHVDPPEDDDSPPHLQLSFPNPLNPVIPGLPIPIPILPPAARLDIPLKLW